MRPASGTRRTTLLLLLLVQLAFASPVLSAPPSDNGDQPISIEADRMVSQEKQNTVVFQGKVDARQGNLIIRCDEMTVLYNNQKAPGKPAATPGSTEKPTSKVEKLICVHNVKVTQGDWLGTGERMEYFATDRKVILSGNAKAWQGQNMVSGKSITYYLDQKRSIVEPDPHSKERVRAVIHPQSKKP